MRGGDDADVAATTMHESARPPVEEKPPQGFDKLEALVAAILKEQKQRRKERLPAPEMCSVSECSMRARKDLPILNVTDRLQTERP
jgi:hypothetical protein